MAPVAEGAAMAPVQPRRAVTTRFLDACSGCGLQYDVSNLEPGSPVRCACGVRFAVRHRQPHSPRALRCSSCGGDLQAGASKCSYCEAEVTLDERRLAEICPACYARAMKGAGYCMECGVAIQPQSLVALREDVRCPRCRGELRARIVGESSIVECGGCGGLWLPPQAFEVLVEDADRKSISPEWLGALPKPQQVDQEESVRYLPCPTCGDFMNRRNFGGRSGIIMDVCREHGLWLDHRELERIVQFIQEGGLQRQRALEAERARARAARPTSSSFPDDGGRPLLPLGSSMDDTLLVTGLRALAVALRSLFVRF